MTSCMISSSAASAQSSPSRLAVAPRTSIPDKEPGLALEPEVNSEEALDGPDEPSRVKFEGAPQRDFGCLGDGVETGPVTRRGAVDKRTFERSLDRNASSYPRWRSLEALDELGLVGGRRDPRGIPKRSWSGSFC